MANQGPNVRNYDRRYWKKCIKCRSWRPKEDIVLDDGTTKTKAFGPHEDTPDGYQVICYYCKGEANTRSRERNPTIRIRHHTATRCLTQLGPLAPQGFTEQLEDYLGYKIRALVKHLGEDLKEREGPTRKLKDALNEGYHIDHIRPLSSFQVVTPDGSTVDWDEFKQCWAIENLRAIPADENLAKGAQYNADGTDGSAHTEEAQEEGEGEEDQELRTVPNPESRSGDVSGTT